MAKVKKTEQQSTQEAPKSPLREGYVEIELLQDHGNCKAGATRMQLKAQAEVLVSSNIAKIIRE